MSSHRPPEDHDDPTPDDPTEVSRRDLLRLGAMAGAGASLGGLLGAGPAAGEATPPGHVTAPAVELKEATIEELQAAMTAGGLTSLDLVNRYLERIAALDQDGPRINSVIQVNQDARRIARALDRERRDHGSRGPLHGIPILLKDNIDTGDRMLTTAGSLALVGPPAATDATVAARLRQAGAVILGKANLSEWANFRGFASSSGWGGRAGQTRNPYVLDGFPVRRAHDAGRRYPPGCL